MKVSLFIFIVLSAQLFSQTKISGLLYTVTKPAVVNSKTPVLVILHGYGSKETDSKEMAKIMSDKFIVFSLRAPHTTTVGGYCWFRMEFLPWKNFRSYYAETETSKKTILSFISNACKTYHADSTQVYLLGFSQGGMMAYETAISAPDKIKGVMALSTRIMEETIVKTNVNWTQVQNLRFYIVGGYSDPVISFLDSYKAHDYLRNMGVRDLTIKLYDIPHTITAEEISELRAWLAARVQR